MSLRHRPSLLFPIFLLAALCPVKAGGGEVHRLVYEGAITPVAAEYITGGIERAETEGATLLVLQLDTPGGLMDSMREIVKAELNSTVPIVVHVAPGGSRAASAGAFITLAAHVAAMAPETNIGSASPVQMGGAAMDSTMSSKVVNDAVAYIASIAERKGRNADVARAFVTDAINLTAAEALEQGVIDLIAGSTAALLDSLQGRTVMIDDREIALDTAEARIVDHEMSGRQRFLKRLANPNVAYILMLLGIYGLFFELSNPGAFAPGIVGAICLLLALFAFQALPVDYTGVGLVLLGVILLILEIKVPSFGALSIGGVTALVLGSLMLFDTGAGWARVSMRVLIPSLVVFVGFFLLCIWLVARSQRRPVSTGPESLVGETGRVVHAIGGEREPGKIVFHGEVWNAVAATPIPLDARVRVVSVEGRQARVEPESSSPDGRNPS